MKKYHYLFLALSLILLNASCAEEEIPINHDLDNTVWVKVNDSADEEIHYVEKLIFANGYVHEVLFDPTEDTLLGVLTRYEYTYNKRVWQGVLNSQPDCTFFLFHPAIK